MNRVVLTPQDKMRMMTKLIEDLVDHEMFGSVMSTWLLRVLEKHGTAAYIANRFNDYEDESEWANYMSRSVKERFDTLEEILIDLCIDLGYDRN